MESQKARDLTEVAAGVRAALVSIDHRLKHRDLTDEISLDEDLGMDSLRYVDLTFALEDAFCIDELPIQNWIDSERERPTPRYTIGSLIRFCAQRIGVPSEHPLLDAP
jgi:acyl carrier protein